MGRVPGAGPAVSAVAARAPLRGKRVLIAKPGLDGHDVGAKVIALALRDAGADVIYTGLRKSPEAIARAAVDEVGHMLAGPYCGMLLADLGAEVIKIEPPEGDIGRAISPHWIGPHNAYFASLNRGKRSVTLDLGTPEGQHALGELAAGAQALITNLRP